MFRPHLDHETPIHSAELRRSVECLALEIPGEVWRDVRAKAEAVLEEYESVERELRYELWINHGHTGMYGDDGEMQCGMCRPPVDFKRDPLIRVRDATFAGRVERAARVAREQGLS